MLEEEDLLLRTLDKLWQRLHVGSLTTRARDLGASGGNRVRDPAMHPSGVQQARSARGPPGRRRTVWQVRDVTAERAREDTLVAERSRNAVLVLGPPLGPLPQSRLHRSRHRRDGARSPAAAARPRLAARRPGSIESHGQCVRAALPPGVVEATEVHGGARRPHHRPDHRRLVADVGTAGYVEATVVPLTGTGYPPRPGSSGARPRPRSLDDPSATR